MLRRTSIGLTYTGPKPGGNFLSRMKFWSKYEPEITKHEAAKVLGQEPAMATPPDMASPIPHAGVSPAKRKAAVAAALKSEHAAGVRSSTVAETQARKKLATETSATSPASAAHHLHPTATPGMAKPQSWFEQHFSSNEFKRRIAAFRASTTPTGVSSHHATGADIGTTRAGLRAEAAAESKIWGNHILGPAFLTAGAAAAAYNIYLWRHDMHPLVMEEITPEVAAERKRKRMERVEELQQEIMFY